MLHQMRHMFLSHVLIVLDPRDNRLEHLHTDTNTYTHTHTSACLAQHSTLASKPFQFQVTLTALPCCLLLLRQPGQPWTILRQDACCHSNDAGCFVYLCSNKFIAHVMADHQAADFFLVPRCTCVCMGTFSSEGMVSLSLAMRLQTCSMPRLRNSSHCITSEKCCSVCV